MMEDDNNYPEECSGCHDDRMTPEEMEEDVDIMNADPADLMEDIRDNGPLRRNGYKCTLCNKHYCKECVLECGCGQILCPNCGPFCAICGQSWCDECLRTCFICNKVICESCYEEVDGKIVCNTCAELKK